MFHSEIGGPVFARKSTLFLAVKTCPVKARTPVSINPTRSPTPTPLSGWQANKTDIVKFSSSHRNRPTPLKDRRTLLFVYLHGFSIITGPWSFNPASGSLDTRTEQSMRFILIRWRYLCFVTFFISFYIRIIPLKSAAASWLLSFVANHKKSSTDIP